MPLYDVRCTRGCGYFNDVFCLLADVDQMICPECSAPVVRLISPVRTIGPTFSNPMTVNQIGRTFTSKSDWDAYQRDNPGTEVLSANSKAWQDHVDAVRNKADRKAKTLGYRDRQDMREKVAQEDRDKRKAT
jgi:hypothetical protein